MITALHIFLTYIFSLSKTTRLGLKINIGKMSRKDAWGRIATRTSAIQPPLMKVGVARCRLNCLMAHLYLKERLGSCRQEWANIIEPSRFVTDITSSNKLFVATAYRDGLSLPLPCLCLEMKWLTLLTNHPANPAGAFLWSWLSSMSITLLNGTYDTM